jgi:hypothetical protein
MVIAVWCERIAAADDRCPPARAALAAALFGRATAAVRHWLGTPDGRTTVEMIAPDDEPSVARGHDGIHLRLPFSWLQDIWTAELPVVLGRFSIALVETSPGRRRVLTVDPALRDVRVVTVSLD